jgi:hypothetical protein
MVKKKHRVIDRTYGIATSDTAALKEMMNKLESNIFQRRIFIRQQNDDGVPAEDKLVLYAGARHLCLIDEDGNLSMTKKKDKRRLANAGSRMS